MTIRPTINHDDTITAIVAPSPPQQQAFPRIALRLPIERSQGHYAGRYFLARCGALDNPHDPRPRQEQWSIYLRRPLFAANRRLNPTYTNSAGSPTEAIWEFGLHSALENTALGDTALEDTVLEDTVLGDTVWGDTALGDNGEAWLATLPEGSTVNLIGPLGNGFALPSDARNLLLLSRHVAGSNAQNASQISALFPLIETMLDNGGRVTLLVRGDDALRKTLLAQLPIAAELRIAQSDAEWWQQIAETAQWADQVAASIPLETTQRLADILREKRFRLLPQFAHILLPADLVCGVGACLACVVPTANGGLTRACIHGPVLDLTQLAR